MAFEALLITCSIHQKQLPQIWLKIQILVNDCFDKRGKNTSGQTKLQQSDLQKKKKKRPKGAQEDILQGMIRNFLTANWNWTF